MKSDRFLFIFLGFFVISTLAGACATDVKYHPGLVSTTARGTLIFSIDDLSGGPFVIVHRHHLTWIESSKRQTRISVAIARPDESGRYQVEFGSDVRQLDLFFLLRNHSMKATSFKRTLGIDTYEFDVNFEKDDNWAENYFVVLKPMLTGYLVEDRYKLSKTDQQFLTDWIDRTEEILAEKGSE